MAISAEKWFFIPNTFPSTVRVSSALNSTMITWFYYCLFKFPILIEVCPLKTLLVDHTFSLATALFSSSIQSLYSSIPLKAIFRFFTSFKIWNKYFECILNLCSLSRLKLIARTHLINYRTLNMRRLKLCRSRWIQKTIFTLMQPSMANLNSPSSRVVKDSTPFRRRILRCKNFGKGESSPSLFLDVVNPYLMRFRHRWILNERTFYSFIILFIWKWILT